VFLWTGSRDAKAGLGLLKDARIPVFYTPDMLARGLRSRLAYHTWRECRLADGFATAPPRSAPRDAAIARALGPGRSMLSESESKRLLAAWGPGSARERLVGSAEAAVEAAEQIGHPVVLKVDSPDIPHKTEAGVVRLNLRDAAQVRTAYAQILASAKAYAPQAEIIGVSVQEMVGEGVEVIVGVSCDPQLGPVLLFGSGGVMVEVYNDVALRRCPITRREAQAMIAEVKGARLLQGFRGRPAADLEALEDTLVRVSHLAMHMEGHLAELDINPLMVLPAGQGVKAVDALVVLRGT
jgi:acyl-CoA synthetase (NDP forming)